MFLTQLLTHIAPHFRTLALQGRRALLRAKSWRNKFEPWRHKLCQDQFTRSLLDKGCNKLIKPPTWMNHSGFGFGANCVEFATLDSKVAKGFVEITSREFTKKIDLLDKKHSREKCVLLFSRQMMHLIFSRFDISKTQGHA